MVACNATYLRKSEKKVQENALNVPNYNITESPQYLQRTYNLFTFIMIANEQ